VDAEKKSEPKKREIVYLNDTLLLHKKKRKRRVGRVKKEKQKSGTPEKTLTTRKQDALKILTKRILRVEESVAEIQQERKGGGGI